MTYLQTMSNMNAQVEVDRDNFLCNSQKGQIS
jgi:hypothetical protein